MGHKNIKNKESKEGKDMPIGKNVNLQDRVIKKTVKVSNTSKASITNKIGQPSFKKGAETYGTEKMTFYVKKDLLKRLYNFAYWDRHSVTEAFNIVIADGLKGKNTKDKGE